MNKSKRKMTLIPSVDSIKISVKGDHTGGEVNKVFTEIKRGNYGIDSSFIKNVYSPKAHTRKDIRKKHEIILQNGMRIGCTSTTGKGQQLPDEVVTRNKNGVETYALASGALVYELGGIMSYNYSKLLDHNNVLMFFSFIRQLFNNTMEITEFHLCFDVLQNIDNLTFYTSNSSLENKRVMNTHYLKFPKKTGFTAKAYNKGIKEKTYLDLTRLEIVVKKCLLDKLGVRFALTDESRITKRNSKILAKEVCNFFKGFVINLKIKGCSSSMIPDEKKLYRQILLIAQKFQGIRCLSNNRYTPLQNLNKEQVLIWKSSYNMKIYQDYRRKKMYLTDSGNFPLLSKTCEDLKMSKTTVLKMQNFLRNKKNYLEADKVRARIEELEKEHLDEITLTAESGYDYKTKKSYDNIVSMIDTASSIFSSYLFILLEDSLNHSLRGEDNLAPEKIASILFGRNIKSLSSKVIKKEVDYWKERFNQTALKKFNMIISINKKKKGHKIKEIQPEDLIS